MDHYLNSRGEPDRASFSGPTPFRLDEGFAEDASSQDENNRAGFERLQSWIMSQSEEDRAEIAYEVLRTLRTSNIAAVVDRLTPLLHMDPLEKLPPEVTAEMFSYLDASALLTASLASQTWRSRILDSRLWQKLYLSQGWGINFKEVRDFEGTNSGMIRGDFKKARGHIRGSDSGFGQPQLKKRATSDWLESKGRQVSADVSKWREQHGQIEADTDTQMDNSDQEMQDAPSGVVGSPSRPNKRHSHDSGDEMQFSEVVNGAGNDSANTSDASDRSHLFKSRLIRQDSTGGDRLDWSYLYKQRQRLEDNWNMGKYTNFQLPHPSHPQEAHTECVYTIQFFGKWLVSGSRDKTLRIWDLETRRLRGKPLTGHSQSVLCLQFDPTEGEDVIISGSSDSSVIVWKFSTGQKLHEIPSAHEESVLNLRFDRRYLVTCSKDKKIKIWNRRQLLPTDADFPHLSPKSEARIPSYIVDIANMEPSLLEARIANGAIKALRPYTHLMTFGSHNAAVNAIQIHGDLLVSASGDRVIKVWSLKDGKCLRSLAGHQKGIACVQFDGRRVVSGSSDNTVRIFDPATGAEVAELKGHTNLVRTVQAGFGDLPGSEEEDIVKARAAEQKYAQDVASGIIVEGREYSRQIRSGETGSSRITIGSKLPPGGGGSKWGKIVSGSYDESIIIWRKNAQGDWVIGQTLRQESAIRASTELRQPPAMSQPQQAPIQPLIASAPVTVAPSAPINAPMMSASQIVQQAMDTSLASFGVGLSNVTSLARNFNTPIAWNVPPRSSSGQASAAAAAASLAGSATQQAFQHMAVHAQNVMSNAMQQALANSSTTNASSTSGQTLSQQPTSHPQPPPQQQSSQFPSAAPTQPVPTHPPQQPPHNQSVSRVFKLQFDARRIICCSQDSRIIGWDFANGDPDIIESSRYFVGP